MKRNSKTSIRTKITIKCHDMLQPYSEKLLRYVISAGNNRKITILVAPRGYGCPAKHRVGMYHNYARFLLFRKMQNIGSDRLKNLLIATSNIEERI